MGKQQKKILLAGAAICLVAAMVAIVASITQRSSSTRTAAVTTIPLEAVTDVVTQPSLTQAEPQTTATQTTVAPVATGDAAYLIRNENERYMQDFDTPESELSLESPGKTIPLDDFFIKTPFFEGLGFGGKGHPMSNGKSEGQFRVACEISHMNEDDPLVLPGKPGASHLHSYFGNNNVDAFTKYDPSDPTSLTNKGGGTCNGFELNRTAYVVPTMLDGKGNYINPASIIVYYKSHNPDIVDVIPQGLQMIAGNPQGGGSFEPSDRLYWACGVSGEAQNSPKQDQIHDCAGGTLNATIQFPNCWDGENLASSDFTSHLAWMENYTCPASHRVHIPQVSVLLYFEDAQNTDGWYLSSDHAGDKPGSSLHSDWWGGWNKDVAEFVGEKCISSGMSCTFGQTGSDVVLAPVHEDLGQNVKDSGVNPLPEGVSEKYFKPLD